MLLPQWPCPSTVFCLQDRTTHSLVSAWGDGRVAFSLWLNSFWKVCHRPCDPLVLSGYWGFLWIQTVKPFPLISGHFNLPQAPFLPSTHPADPPPTLPTHAHTSTSLLCLWELACSDCSSEWIHMAFVPTFSCLCFCYIFWWVFVVGLHCTRHCVLGGHFHVCVVDADHISPISRHSSKLALVSIFMPYTHT